MMKKLLMAGVMLSAVVFGNVAPARANDKCGMCAMKMDSGKKADTLALVLDLNDKQKGQVKDLIDAKMKKMEPTMEQFKKAHDQSADEFQMSLKKILSTAQTKKFDTWKDLNKSGCGH